MSLNFAPQIIAADAPFNDAQRAWLNRLFAEALPERSAHRLSPQRGPSAPREDDSTPWKDPALAIEERMALAQAAASAGFADGRHGAAGLWPVWLQLRRLLTRYL